MVCRTQDWSSRQWTAHALPCASSAGASGRVLPGPCRSFPPGEARRGEQQRLRRLDITVIDGRPVRSLAWRGVAGLRLYIQYALLALSRHYFLVNAVKGRTGRLGKFGGTSVVPLRLLRLLHCTAECRLLVQLDADCWRSFVTQDHPQACSSGGSPTPHSFRRAAGNTISGNFLGAFPPPPATRTSSRLWQGVLKGLYVQLRL